MKRLTIVLLTMILCLVSASVWTPLVLSQGSYVYDLVLEWGGYGDGDGHFCNPTSITLDSADNVYVADGCNWRIQKLTSTGVFVTKWGSYGTGDGQFGDGTGYTPGGVAVSQDGYVYVADTGGYRIQKFDSNGVFITKWTVQAWQQSYLAPPDEVAVDSSGFVYVLDGYEQVQKFASNGTFVTKWGHYGAEDGEFETPSDIAVAPSGYVYVADSPQMPLQGMVARIQKFTLSGEFVAKWLIPDFHNGVDSIAISRTGNVYAGDNTGARSSGSVWDVVEEFTPDGTFIAKIDVARLANRESALASDIAVDSNNNLYVLESSISSPKGPVLKFGLVLRYPPNPAASPMTSTMRDYPYVEFSWAFSDPDPGDAMSAWEIQTSTLPNGAGTLLWDSGKQLYAGSPSITLYGNPAFWYSGSFHFSEGVTYHWRVKTWDKYDLEGAYCADQTFMIGSSTTTSISTSATTSTPSTSTSTTTTSATTTTAQTQTSTTSTQTTMTTTAFSSTTPTTAVTTTTQTSTIISTTVQTTVSTIVISGSTTTIAGLQMQIVSNSSVSDLVFDSTKGLLNFTVSGASGTLGFFDATIAKSLLLGQPVVLIDGAQHSASITEDANFWHVHVTYTHSQHHVTIGGSNTVPEFPSATVLLVVLMLVMGVVRRQRESSSR